MKLNSPDRFKEEDKKKVIDFLNFVAKRAKFDGLNVKEVIEFYGLLSFCQQVLIYKLDAHILDSIKVYEVKKEKTRSRIKEKKNVTAT